MAQDRTLLAVNARLRVERVRFHASAPQWSPVYHAPSRRLVLPGSGAAQFRQGGHGSGGNAVLIDCLTAFCVDAAMAYQLKPAAEAELGARSSVVVSEAPGAVAGSLTTPAHAWLLTPAALYQLRLHWRLLEQGRATADATAVVLGQTFHAALPMPAGEGAPHAAVLRARRFLLAQPGASHSLHDVADAVHSSAFHLARTFRRHTGLSLHQYRQRLRLAAALALLEGGERDLAGLAHELGFCSQSHFGTVFRREIGVSPAQARAALGR